MSNNYNTFIGTENNAIPSGTSRTASHDGGDGGDGGGGIVEDQLWTSAFVPNNVEEAQSSSSRSHHHHSAFGCELPHRGPNADVTSFKIKVEGGDDNRHHHNTSSSTTATNSTIRSRMMWNLFFCIMAWACTVANLTLVVGTSNVILLSIGGNPALSSAPLAAFFLGASLVSFLVTPWLFRRRGRRVGFLCGVSFGLLGSVLGFCAILFRSPVVLISATGWFGAAVGIGFYLRFAALEVADEAWAERAVALVVTGGCIAAFAGPESAEATRGMFGDDEEYEFLEVFVLTGVFSIANGVFTCLVHFPSNNSSNLRGETSASNYDDDDKSGYWQRIRPIVRKRHFSIPVLISAMSWIIMALPMSVLRVAMHQVGFTSRQSLIAIEFHFLGMYSPGFFSGIWIAKYGPRWVCMGASLIFLLAFACLQSANGADEESSDIVPWVLGMVVIGVGWNFAFSASTVGLTRSYAFSHPECKSLIQAVNEGLTFLFAGALICCASFIYQAGGEGLEGWWTVNWVVMGFIILFSLVLLLDVGLEQTETETPVNEKWSPPSKAYS